MAFQFLCPQGHLLQGDESQAGQQCKCPYCETLFVVPAPVPPAGVGPTEQPQPEPSPPPNLSPGPDPATFVPQQPAIQQPAIQQPAIQQPAIQQPAAGPEFGWPEPQPQPEGEGPAGFQVGPDFGGGSAQPAPSISELPGTSPIIHILCPSGHQLETPRDMLGQDALCPYCQVQFRLRFEDSLEYRKQKQEERELQELRTGKKWMQWSIAAAVVVILGVILMVVLAMAE